MKDDIPCPKFYAYFQRVEGKSVLIMPRTDWEALQVCSTEPVQIDIRSTPMAAVATDAVVMAAMAYRLSSKTAQIEIFRYDPSDAPTSINKDSYSVIEDVLHRPDYPTIVNRASTSDNDNLRCFLSEHVFLIKEEPGNDHWLKNLPG